LLKREEVYEVACHGRKVTCLLPGNRDGKICRAVLQTETAEQAAAIAQALDGSSADEQCLPFIFGSSVAATDTSLVRRGRITIKHNRVSLVRQLTRGLLFSRQSQAIAPWYILAVVLLFLNIDPFAAMPTLAGHALSAAGLFVVLFLALQLVPVIVYSVMFLMQSTRLAPDAIHEMQHAGPDMSISYLAPDDFGRRVGMIRLPFHACTPADAATIAQALATPAAQVACPIIYGPLRDSSTLGLLGDGELTIGPRQLDISGRVAAWTDATGVVGGMAALTILGALLAAALFTLQLPVLLAAFIALVAMILVTYALSCRRRTVHIPRTDITAVTRDGRQVTFAFREGGKTGQGVVHTPREAEAMALALAE
jgi:hypothetical protein